MAGISRKRLLEALKDESGVSALIIAAVIAVIAFTALSIFLNNFLSTHALNQVKSGASGQAKVLKAVYGYYLSQGYSSTGTVLTGATPHTLPCPDTASSPTGKQPRNGNGQVDPTACSNGISVGVIPWADLGLSQQDVVDSYGNYYTYVVSGAANGLCESITKNYASTGNVTQEYTGRLLSPALEALLTSQTSGSGRKVPFAIIGHGADRTGARSRSGSATATPQDTFELQNSISNIASGSAIYTGPMSTQASTQTTTYFDDQVLVPATIDLQSICSQLTPGGKINASMSDSFDNAATTTTNFGALPANGVSVGASSSDPTNQVAKFAASGAASSYLATSTANFNFAPVVRPIYVSAEWFGTSSTFSLATRATAAQLTAGTDTFVANAMTGAGGITLRFNDATTSSHLNILQDGTAVPSASLIQSGTFTLVSGKAYTIEAYDNGSDVWMRITQTDNSANTALAYATGITGDAGGSQQVLFINGTGTSELDNVLLGFPMFALETSGVTGSFATTAASANGTTTGNLTLEAWVYPRALPSSNGTIVAKWGGAASQSYRLRMSSSGQSALDVVVPAGTATTETYLGPALPLNQWSHIAVTYAYVGTTTTQAVTFYQNGDPYSATSSSLSTLTGGVQDASVNFSVGGDYNGGVIGADSFTGDISDVRVWSIARNADDINGDFQARLSAVSGDSSISGLVVNWRLDSESGGLGVFTPAVEPTGQGTSGQPATSALHVPTLAQYFRPLSTTPGFCPNGTIAGAYECDFRSASQSMPITIPNNLLGIYASVWGAGGGGYAVASTSSTGGGGGFSGGFIQSIGTKAIPGQKLDIYVGGGGTGSSTSTNGAGGGAASAVVLDTGTVSSLVAGGGGGASYSAAEPINENFLSQFIGGLLGFLQSLIDGIVNGVITFYPSAAGYGAGGAGGGGGGATAAALTTQAPDSVNMCGGRGGDNGPFGANPPTASVCANPTVADGGGAPTGTGGGGGTSGNGNLGALGGLSAAGNGGAGYAATSPFGGGGGGGGGYYDGGTGGIGTKNSGGGGGYAGAVTAGIYTISEPSGFGGGGGSGYYDTTTGNISNVSGFAGFTNGDAGNGHGTNFYASPGNYVTTFFPGQGGTTSTTNCATGNAAANCGYDGTVVLIW